MIPPPPSRAKIRIHNLRVCALRVGYLLSGLLILAGIGTIVLGALQPRDAKNDDGTANKEWIMFICLGGFVLLLGLGFCYVLYYFSRAKRANLAPLSQEMVQMGVGGQRPP